MPKTPRFPPFQEKTGAERVLQRMKKGLLGLTGAERCPAQRMKMSPLPSYKEKQVKSTNIFMKAQEDHVKAREMNING